MKLRALIIDDEPLALEKLSSYVEKVPFLQLAAKCMSAVDATAYLSAQPVDVIFTDINMPDLNGMEFVNSLSTPPMVVFITAHASYAAESYRLSAVDYLLKPYSFADFQMAANKVLEQYALRHRKPDQAQTPDTPRSDGSLFVKIDYRYVRLSLTDITYIKGYGEYLQIFTAGNPSPYVTLSSFAAIREKLSANFLQIHRSYLVNMDAVERIERGRIVMEGDTWLPVGDSYKAILQDYLASHSIGQKKGSSLNG